jgi:hypothetical protein
MFIHHLKVGNLGYSNISKLFRIIIQIVSATVLTYTLAACGSDSSGNNDLAYNADTTAPSITSSSTAVEIDENSGAGQIVYTATSDGSAATYTLSNADSRFFTIDVNTGIVTLTDNPDFETQSRYTFTLTATDSSGNSSSITVTLDINNIELASFNLTGIEASASDIKQMSLTWDTAAMNADQNVIYTICEKDTTKDNNCNDLASVTDVLTVDVTVSSLVSALSKDYFVLASLANEFKASTEANLTAGDITKMIGYFKASNSESSDSFGSNVALSGDGHTLAVGAPYEDNSAKGVITNGSESTDENEDQTFKSGAVYLFSNKSGKWMQMAYVKASNAGAGDNFGTSLALNTDGTLLVVGAKGEDNSAKGVITNGSEITDENATKTTDSGAVYIFSNSGDTWTQTTYIKASNSGEFDSFGTSVALSAKR